MALNYENRLLINGINEANEMLKALGKYCEHLEKTNEILKEKIKEMSENNEIRNSTRSND